MSRSGAIVCVLAVLLFVTMGLSVSDAADGQRSTPVATAQANAPVAPNHIIWPYTLVLTLQDSGGAFVVPVNALILLRIPVIPFNRLQYDPNILQPAPQPYVRPQPLPQPYEGAPGSSGSSGSAPGTVEPMTNTIATPAAQPPAAIGDAPMTAIPMPAQPVGTPHLLPPIQYGGVALRAVGPGTTDLRL
ncbi:MAG TPA: hypothetical protein VKQ72_07650, partial [Aggregatilineales bacterium]|nr:hypothetical protein [Aggregatilineales bacterium]